MMNRRDAMKGVAAGIGVTGMSSAVSARSSSDTLLISHWSRRLWRARSGSCAVAGWPE